MALSTLINAFVPANGAPPRTLWAFACWALSGAWRGIWIATAIAVVGGVTEVMAAMVMGIVIDAATGGHAATFFADNWALLAGFAAFFLVLRPLAFGLNSAANFLTIAPNVAYMERAWHQAQGGDMAGEPFMVVKVPSMVDPTLAPEGHHIMNIFGGHAPYSLAKGDWDSRREELWEKVLAVLKTQFPDIEAKILHRQVLTPLDLERIFDLPNGHVHHGEISADQMFFRRHSPQFADYRSPVEFLYQASASVHPGGGVTGVPGHTAAKVILEDRRKWS